MSRTGWLFISESGSLVDRSSYLSFREGDKHTFTVTLQKTGTGEIPLWIKAGDSYLTTPQNFTGAQVFLYDKPPSGAIRVFAGSITQIEIDYIGKKGNRSAILQVATFERCFDTLLIKPQAYLAEEAGDIFTALFNGEAAGVPVSLGTVNAPFFINSVTYNWDRLSAAFRLLATASSTIWGVDLATLTAYLKPISTTPSPYTLQSSQVRYGSCKWSLDDKDYRNRQIVRGSLDAFSDSSELFPKFALPQSFGLRNPAQTITGAWLTSNTQNTASGTFSANPSPGDTVTIAYPQTGSVYNWAPAAPYQVGQIIIDPANHIQKCTVAGLSGNQQPAWNHSGGNTSDGPGSPNPGLLGGVVWKDLGLSGAGGLGASVYTFVTALDNAQWGQVLIGANAAATCQNLIDAINCTTARQGATFSWPTWENPLVNADNPSGASLTIRNKSAGAGYQAALSASSSHFSWATSTTVGGVTTLGTVELQVAQNGSSNTANIYFTPGSNIVALASIPANAKGVSVQIQYQRYGNDCVICENTDQVNARALLEGGTGKYQQILQDTSNTSSASLLEECQSALEAYGVTPVTFEFETWRPGLAPGQLLSIAIAADAPTGLDALVNGDYLVLEITAELVRIAKPREYMDQTTVPGGGHYRYTVTVIDVAQIYTYLDYWLKLGGSGGGGTLIAGPPPNANSLLPPLGPTHPVMPWKPYAEAFPWSRTGWIFSLQVGPTTAFINAVLNALNQTTVAIQGAPPVNMLSGSANTPSIDQYATVSAHVGNTLPAGDFIARVYGYDSAGNPTDGSNISSFTISAAASRVSIGANWGAATVAYEVFIGQDENTLAGLGQVSGTPSTIDIDSFGDYPGDYAPPDPFVETLLVRAKQMIHGGRAITTVLSSVWNSGPNTTSIGVAIPSAASANAFNGCYLIRVDGKGALGFSVLGPITASDTGSPTCILTLAGNVAGKIFAGSLILISTRSDTNTATSIGDSGFVSPFAPSGLTAHAEINEIVRILFDPTGAAGATAVVTDNTSTVASTTPFELPDGTPVTPGTGCVFTFEAPSWGPSSVADAARNAVMPTASAHNEQVVGTLDCAALAGKVALIQVLLEDAQGNTSIETTDTLRMAYIPTGSGYYPVAVSGGIAAINPANGLTQALDLPNDGSVVTVSIAGIPPGAGTRLKLFVRTPSGPAWNSGATYSAGQTVLGADGKAYSSLAGGNSGHDPTQDISHAYWGPGNSYQTPVFTGGINQFATDVASGSRYTASPVANTQDELDFTFHGSGTTVTLATPTIGGSIP